MFPSMNKTMKTLRLGGDARSSRGRMSRGNNIYKGGSPSPTTPNLQKMALRKLKGKR